MRDKVGIPRRERQGDERRRIGLEEGRERSSPATPPVEAAATGTPEFAAGLQVTDAERVWIRANLGPFQKNELIVDVLRRIKAGKEATVYVCSAHPSTGRTLVAAKVYRERSLRSSKNQGHYQQGRALLDEDGRSSWRLAGSQKSQRGKAATQTSWLMHEFTLLQTLHAQGADVPEPIEHGEQALLMEFIGDELDAAPTLNDFQIDPSDAQRLFERVIFNVELLLGLGWVHGDLSPYNMLYHHGRIVLIDFPQVVNCENNPRAREIFERDIERVAQYFARVGWSVDAPRLASELWSKHVPEPEPDAVYS
jgi:RIO kinase 1